MKSITELTMFITGRNPRKQQPKPQDIIPPATVEVPHPRNPRIFIIADIRKKVFEFFL